MRVALFAALVCSVAAKAKFEDAWEKFCGVPDCYDELGVFQNATKAQIRRAYRSLSVEFHPDKWPNDDVKAKRFARVSRANEVLTNDEERKKLDYYIENPSEYLSLYGPFVKITYAPKTDVRVVFFILLLFISLMQPAIQISRHQQYVSKLEKAAINKLPLTGGGSPESMEIRRRAEEVMAADPKAVKALGGSKRDQLVATIKKLISELEIEGVYRKPSWRDVLIVKLFATPMAVFAARQRKSALVAKLATGEAFTEAEKQELVEYYLGGPVAWDNLSDAQQDELISQDAHVKATFDAWIAKHEQSAAEKPADLAPKAKKQLRQRRKAPAGFVMDE